MTLTKKPFENIVGKGENAGNQHFLLFPQFFLLIRRRVSVFCLHLSSAHGFNLDQSKNLSLGKELKWRYTPIGYNQPTVTNVLCPQVFVVICSKKQNSGKESCDLFL